MKALLVGATLGALGLGFVAGRVSLPAPGLASVPGPASAPLHPTRVQAQNDPRELLPLSPGPGQQPGQSPGPQSGPLQGQPQGECPVLLLKDGQLYQLQPGPGAPRPGEGPGQAPGNGGPGPDDELFPLQPYNGPSPLPGLPFTAPPART